MLDSTNLAACHDNGSVHVMDMLRCVSCGEVKQRRDFTPGKQWKSGGTCRPCQKAKNKANVEKNKERIYAQNRARSKERIRNETPEQRAARISRRPELAKRSCTICSATPGKRGFEDRHTRTCLSCTPVGTRLCLGCKIVKPLSSFYERKDRSGRSRILTGTRCLDGCLTDPSTRTNQLLFAAEGRALAKGVPFDRAIRAHVSRVLEEGYCEITGLRFQRPRPRCGPQAFSPSIDRVVPSLGYVPGNVRVVCWAVNAAIGGWGLDVARIVAAALLSASPAGLPRTSFSPAFVTTFAPEATA